MPRFAGFRELQFSSGNGAACRNEWEVWSMSVKRSLFLALGGALLFPAMGRGAGPNPVNPDALTLTPPVAASESDKPAETTGTTVKAPNGGSPIFLDAAPAEEAPNIH